MHFIQSITVKILSQTERDTTFEQSQECIVTVTETLTCSHWIINPDLIIIGKKKKKENAIKSQKLYRW